MTPRERLDRAVAALVRSRIVHSHNPECPCPLPLLYVVQCLIAHHYDQAGRPAVIHPGALGWAMHNPDAAHIRRTAVGILTAARYHLLERTAA